MQQLLSFHQPVKACSFLNMSLAVFLLMACSQAGNPGRTGQTLATSNANGTGATAAAGTLKATSIAADKNLQTRFPRMARLQLSVTSTAAVTGLPIQVNISPTGAPVDLKLPTGLPITIRFDVFDAAGLYLGTGTQQSTIQANTNPSIPVTINPVAVGTIYINPLNGRNITNPTGTGGVAGTTLPSPVLSVRVIQGASMQAIANVTVMLGAAGVVASTDNNGIVNFYNMALPQDVHVFSGTQAISVMQFNGASLTVPFPEITTVQASITVNAPTGPTLAAGELLDIYLSDGMSIQVIGGIANDATPLHTALMRPMRGPVSITAMIEQPLNPTPKTDHGIILLSVASGHTAASPIAISMADPATQARVTPLGFQSILNNAPIGLQGIQHISSDVFAVLAGDVYALVSHKDNRLLAANRRDISIWPVAGTLALMRHIQVQDRYAASSEVWQREQTALSPNSFINMPIFATVPSISSMTKSKITWNDQLNAPRWHAYCVQLKQGTKSWKIYGFYDTRSVLIPTPPVTQHPFLVGFPATAIIQRFNIHAQAGFLLNAPDLWYLARMLDQRASSAAVSFVP